MDEPTDAEIERRQARHFIDSTYNTPTRIEAYKYAACDGLQNLQADQARVAVR
jgi:hypothetical protein